MRMIKKLTFAGAMAAAAFALSGCMSMGSSVDDNGNIVSWQQSTTAAINAAVVDPQDANLNCRQLQEAIAEVERLKELARGGPRVNGTQVREAGASYWRQATAMPEVPSADFLGFAEFRLTHLRQLMREKRCG